ncbi:hypothetical protein ACTFIZ_011894 [Dictyostelium cf. discoideum]
MTSNQNTINNNIDNNKLCTIHPNRDIVFFCLDCKLIPCCIQCTSSKGEHHGHRTDILESTSNIISLMNNFKDDIYQKVIERIEKNKTILKQSNDKFNDIQSQFEINNNSLKKEIKKIHDIISIIELDIKKQLETTFENNTLINTIITSSINNDNQILSTIVNNENENENYNENDNITTIEKLNEILKFKDQQIYNNCDHDFIIDRGTIKIIKQYQQSLIVLNNNNIDNSNKLKEYDNQIIHFNNQIIDDIKNNLKSIYSLNNFRFKIEIDENNNEFFKWNNLKFYIHIDGDFLEFTDNEGIALKDNCNILSKLKNQLPSTVMLLDGFNQKLTAGILPYGVRSLDLGDIKQELIIAGILPESVRSLDLGDIKQELIIGSIPNTVMSVFLLDGFNQKLTAGILPYGVRSLHLGDIKQELIIGSIPNTVTSVFLLDGFNQKLTAGILPKRVTWLYISDIKQELIIGSIPSTVTHVYLLDGFNQKLTAGILPEGVELLDLCDIKQELIIGSIPNSVKSVYVSRSFKHQIKPYVSKNYFRPSSVDYFIISINFEMRTLCGLSEVTLLEVIDKFIESAYGDPNTTWWNKIVYHREQSGGDVLTSWLATFCVFNNDGKYNDNEYIESFTGEKKEDFPWPRVNSKWICIMSSFCLKILKKTIILQFIQVILVQRY